MKDQSTVEEFVIENDLPIPPAARGKPKGDITSPLHKIIRQLEPGQSVKVPKEHHRSARTYVTRTQKDTGRRFTTRTIEDGAIRVWRIE